MKIRHIVLLGLWLLFIAVTTFIALNARDRFYDFSIYYRYAERVAKGEPIYENMLAGLPYVYPPFLVQGIAPLTILFDFKTISLGWHVFNLVLLIISVLLINQTIEDPTQRFMFWLMPIVFIPTYQSMHVGQVSILLLAYMVSAWYAYKRGQPYITGGLLAFITWIKIYPIFFILYFILKREWKVVASAFVFGILLLFVQIIVADVPTLVTYFTDVLPNLSGEAHASQLYKNSSIFGFAYRLFTESTDTKPIIDSPMLASVSRLVMTLGVIGGSLFLIMKPRQNEDAGARFDLEYSLVLIVAMLFSSTLWISSMPPLILSYQLLLKQQPTKPVRWLAWFSLALISYFFLYILGSRTPAFILFFGFYAIILLWGLILWQLRKTVNNSLDVGKL